MSHPNTTLQKPKPPSTAEKNLSRWMYLPRRIPSMSETATFTFPMVEFRSASTMPPASRASLRVRFMAGFLGMGAPGGDGEEMGKGRRGLSGGLGGIIPAPHSYGVGGERLRHEGIGLASREGAALQLQAALRILGQGFVVRGLQRAQRALRVDVQPDRLDHGGREERAKERDRVVLVLVVDAARARRVALQVQQVAEIVQQRGGDERVGRAFGFGAPRGLKGVLELRHALAAVLDVAVAAKKRLDVGQGEAHGYFAGVTRLRGARSGRAW